MKKNLFALIAIVAMALATPVVHAADISNSLVAGKWSETSELSGDERRYVKMTKLTAGVSTTDNLNIPANALGSVYVTAYTDSLVDGISATLNTYGTSPTGFKLTGGTVSYTDVVSDTTQLGSLVTGTTVVSASLASGQAAAARVTAGATLGTGEQIEVRVRYKLPSKCRWPASC